MSPSRRGGRPTVDHRNGAPALRSLGLLAAALLAAVASACADDGEPGAGGGTTTSAATATTTTAPAGGLVVLNGQGNDLVAYASEPPFTRQVVVRNATDDSEHGLDMNGQICFDPQDPSRFVAGEDTGQPNPPAGWGIFELDGDRVGELSARQVGKLTPTYQPADDEPENYGCGFLDDGRIVTVDVGSQATGGGTGQLIVWFPPFESREVRYCKLDVSLPTGQGVLVDGDAVYVAAARAGVFRYDVTTFPTSDDPFGGCTGRDATGAPVAEGVERTLFIEPGDANRLATPNAIAKGPGGRLYVSSVLNGVIAELDAGGRFLRAVLEPPAGETLGAEPFSTGTPLGLAVGPDGTVYFADIGIVIGDDGVGPGRSAGAVRRIRFEGGEPLAPETIDSGLTFPDGIGLRQVG